MLQLHIGEKYSHTPMAANHTTKYSVWGKTGDHE
jgi:hypothetical protein